MKTVLLERLVQEARELLQTSASGLLTLERDPSDATAINEVFRAVHTLKGSSGLFDTPPLTRLVHAGEDVLSQVRTGAMALDSNLVDLLLDSLDHVGGFIDQLDRDGTLSGDADRIATGQAGALRARLGGAQTAAVAVVEETLAPAPLAWLDGFTAEELAAARAQPAAIVVRYIRNAAVDKGVVNRDQADALSDQEAINLIYRPGFSTAAEVSDLSGRGVGMDVVLSTVQKLGGRVSVSSQLGQGTLTRLSLPLSMAVTRVMVVDIGSSLYGIPIDHVVQTARLDPSVIQRIKHREVFVLRDEVVPLIRMTVLLGGTPAHLDPDRGEAVLVCRVEGRTVGLVIDDFREGMDVILKPMTGLLAEVSGYCGTTLLGDGRVLLVLDLKELL